MTSFSDLQLSIWAILLSIVALYLHLPLEVFPPWFRNKDAGSISTTTGSQDFADVMHKTGKKVIIFYGSQTGTAEEYATRLAKEIKAKYGLSSLVCDPQEFDFNVLDMVPDDALVIFVIATYGEGEPTDNAVGLVDFLEAEELDLSQGGSSLENLKYLMFCLGNTTYENFCATGIAIDKRLQNAKATRIGPRGEGDDDKSLEEDYLAWKDVALKAIEKNMGWREGLGGGIQDFEVRELELEQESSEVYLGELSSQSLLVSRGIHDAKNPFISPIINTKELFQDGDRNCVSVGFDIKNSGIRYQTGDHVGIWPLNPDREVDRFLRLLQLESKRHQVVDVTSLDMALAKVPFPTPTTYASIFRHYLDISQLASREAIQSLAIFAPTEKAKVVLEQLGTDKDAYHSIVVNRGLRLSEVLLFAAGDSLTVDSNNYECTQCTPWTIPFGHIVSCIPRLQPRYYSISSSPRLYPDSIHVTAVVTKSIPFPNGNLIYGLGSNYLLSLKDAITGTASLKDKQAPVYAINGPRNKHFKNAVYAVPLHTRLSKFRMPRSVRIPLIMIGPGTGVAPFRAFLQERVALARRAKGLKGPAALKNWATMDLFYGCRRSDWDFLYKDEWESYARELDGKFRMHVALSREPGQPKKYVQQLMEEQAETVVESIIEKKGYIYICGDAKHMAREVEATLESIIGKSMGGSHTEGARELKLLKDRKRLMLDVWS